MAPIVMPAVTAFSTVSTSRSRATELPLGRPCDGPEVVAPVAGVLHEHPWDARVSNHRDLTSETQPPRPQEPDGAARSRTLRRDCSTSLREFEDRGESARGRPRR